MLTLSQSADSDVLYGDACFDSFYTVPVPGRKNLVSRGLETEIFNRAECFTKPKWCLGRFLLWYCQSSFDVGFGCVWLLATQTFSLPKHSRMLLKGNKIGCLTVLGGLGLYSLSLSRLCIYILKQNPIEDYFSSLVKHFKSCCFPPPYCRLADYSPSAGEKNQPKTHLVKGSGFVYTLNANGRKDALDRAGQVWSQTLWWRLPV